MMIMLMIQEMGKLAAISEAHKANNNCMQAASEPEFDDTHPELHVIVVAV